MADAGAGNEIAAVVSDFGGVLTTPLVSSFMALQDEVGVSPEHFAGAMRAVSRGGRRATRCSRWSAAR